ncbi:MAG: flagellar biosynthetic protein FliO, partial [Pseudomonadales bacterium]|nr:flagellar biosynthetic protein FliO [Pseudomonadales bacterium]
FAVLAVIVGFGFLVIRFTNISEKTNGPIQVLAQAPMGVKERVILLQVGSEQVLIGQSVAGLQTLHVLVNPVEEKSLAAAKPLDFSATLKAVINK